MSTVANLTLEEAKAKVEKLKVAGKNESTSKEVGKLVNYIKTQEPEKYGASQVSSAQKALKFSTAAGAVDSLGYVSPEISTLEKQLADRQKAIITATGNINDNPFYSEATRVGKLAKLQEQSQQDVTNLTNQLAQKRADQRFAIQQGQWQKEFDYKQTQDAQMQSNRQQSFNPSQAKTAPVTSTDTLKYLENAGGKPTTLTTAPTTALQPPPMSANPGTIAEYPQGSGIIWTMGTDGRWF